MDQRNSSQDPDYVGPVGHEKKFHKDHFEGIALIGSSEWYTWSDGTKHRFKEKKPNVRNAQATRRRGGTHGKKGKDIQR